MCFFCLFCLFGVVFFSNSLRHLCANEGPFLKMSPIVEDRGGGGGGGGTVYYQTNVHDILIISCIIKAHLHSDKLSLFCWMSSFW